LPDRSPSVPKESGEKADRTQAQSGDGDDCHGYESMISVSLIRVFRLRG
jgi:hypothetical protein